MTGNEIDLSKFVISENDFEIGKLLGKGSYAHVFAARHKVSKEIFALKKFHSNFTTKKNRQMFEREVSVMAKLIHNCVLGLRGYFLPPTDSQLCPLILMDYMKNGDLFSVLVKEAKTKTVNGWNDTKRLMNAFGIAYGMAHIHACGGIHRDLKPANIMLNDELEPKIADFGLAKIEDDNNLQSMVGGSPFWMAPELFNGEQYTNAVDVYAYGVLLYQLLTLKIPFDGKITTIALGKKICSGERPEIPDTCPPFYAEIIQKCWEQDPQDRPTFEQIYRHILDDTEFMGDTNIPQYKAYIDKVMNTDNTITVKSLGDPYKAGLAYMEHGEYENACTEFERAAQSNNIDACYSLGKLIIDRKVTKYDQFTGIKFLKKAADGGHPEAQYECGLALYKGEIVNSNKVMAAEYFIQAAKSYIAGAILMLSRMLIDGDGVEKNQAKSKKLLTMMADKKNMECAYTLGKYCYEGEFGQKDLKTAEKYLEIAVKGGVTEAEPLLKKLRQENQPKPSEFSFDLALSSSSQFNPPISPKQPPSYISPPGSGSNQTPQSSMIFNPPPAASITNQTHQSSMIFNPPPAASMSTQSSMIVTPQPSPYNPAPFVPPILGSTSSAYGTQQSANKPQPASYNSKQSGFNTQQGPVGHHPATVSTPQSSFLVQPPSILNSQQSVFNPSFNQAPSVLSPQAGPSNNQFPKSPSDLALSNSPVPSAPTSPQSQTPFNPFLNPPAPVSQQPQPQSNQPQENPVRFGPNFDPFAMMNANPQLQPKSTPTNQPMFLDFSQQQQQTKPQQLNFSFFSKGGPAGSPLQMSKSRDVFYETPQMPVQTPYVKTRSNSFELKKESAQVPPPPPAPSPHQAPHPRVMQFQGSKIPVCTIATKEMIDRANAGDIEAMYDVATALATESNPKSDQESAKYMRKAADLGHVEAKFQCGNYLARGFGTKSDISKAIVYYLDAANHGHALAMLECSKLLTNGEGCRQDLRKAAYMCKLAAEAGNVEAMYNFANIVKNGLGVPANPADAQHAYILAADRGHVKAMQAAAYYMWTVEKDLFGALKYYKMAADQQDCDGLSSYGHFLAEGLGCRKDPARAAECFRAAALMGSTLGMYNYAVTLQTGNGIPKDVSSAARFYKMAADRGDQDACIHYSQLLATGWEGTPKDMAGCAAYAKKAADAGNARGMFQYGKMLWSGTGVPKDQTTAAAYIKSAALQGYNRAKDFCNNNHIML